MRRLNRPSLDRAKMDSLRPDEDANTGTDNPTVIDRLPSMSKTLARGSMSPAEALKELETANLDSRRDLLKTEDADTFDASEKPVPLADPPSVPTSADSDDDHVRILQHPPFRRYICWLCEDTIYEYVSERMRQVLSVQLLCLQSSLTYGHRQVLEEPLMVGNITQRFKVVREQEGAGDNVTVDVKEFILKQNRRCDAWQHACLIKLIMRHLQQVFITLVTTLLCPC